MPSEINSHQALLVLNGLPHIGPVLFRRLMEAFGGDPVSLLKGSKAELVGVSGLGDKAADVIVNWPRHFDLNREESSMAKKGTRFLTQDCEDYPNLLRQTYDPPIGLYWQGEYSIDRPCVAIVGTRRATLYGRKVAKTFAADLAQIGFCIVSGMARGTDTAAHEGALEVGGKTVAVMGCGLDIIYPPENLDLYREIARHGALAGEFPFGRRADRQTFPMRNRVVAGMCEAVIVVESDVAGGSMITARFAGEQGRTLMAVPGRIDQASSAGCHQLIRDGAIMVTSVDDILEELRYRRPEPQELNLGEERDVIESNLSEPEHQILEFFKGGAVLTPDAISELANRPFSEVAAVLMGLELKRAVVKRSDGRFETT